MSPQTTRYAARLACALALSLLPLSAFADAPALSALAKMPVKELTIFKDGHAFVLHRGVMPTDSVGNVQMDYLPTPIVGTFWPFSANKNVKLSAVTASPRRVRVERTALNVPELIEANPGAEVSITEVGGKTYRAHIVNAPQRSGEELDKTDPPNSGEKLPVKGAVFMVKTATGTAAIPRERIQDITFTEGYKHTLSVEEFRNLLTLKLEWANNKPSKTADVGMMYLQKGIRWIPSYKVSLDGKGSAKVTLQATLINEMTDLQDVTANLVIGVPSFAFQDTLDPIGLQQTLAQLSPYFQNSSQMSNSFSNGMMSQVAGQGGGFGGGRGAMGAPVADGGGNLGPEVAGSGKNEDLFVFTVKHLTLKKGQRMVVPIVESSLKYRDLYTVDIGYTPPREMRQNMNFNEQQLEIMRLQNAPKASHKIRITNSSNYPLTTAPALILNGDKVLAQGTMTYTSIGGEADITVTTAVDIKVKKQDKEANKTANAENWNGDWYGRIDLAGTLSLTNYRSQDVEVEVTRSVLGAITQADHDGAISSVNVFEADDYTARSEYPSWWGWYSWPYWWNHFNGVGRVVWKVKVESGKSVDLNYSWRYFWR